MPREPKWTNEITRQAYVIGRLAQPSESKDPVEPIDWEQVL
jgi:hypothetical protein